MKDNGDASHDTISTSKGYIKIYGNLKMKIYNSNLSQ